MKRTTKKSPRKSTAKKKTTKKVARKKVIKRRNPEYFLETHQSHGLEYIKLSDFTFQLQREYVQLSNDGYYDWDYEIEGILKYEFRNSNKVFSGNLNLVSLEFFKTLIDKKLKEYYDSYVIEALKNTFHKIPPKVNLIDTGN